MYLNRAAAVGYTEDTAGLWQNPDVVSAVSVPVVGAAYSYSLHRQTDTSEYPLALRNHSEIKNYSSQSRRN